MHCRRVSKEDALPNFVLQLAAAAARESHITMATKSPELRQIRAFLGYILKWRDRDGTMWNEVVKLDEMIECIWPEFQR